MASSFLGLESLHVFITGAAGGIDSEVVKEFLSMARFSMSSGFTVHSMGSTSLVRDKFKATTYVTLSPTTESLSRYVWPLRQIHSGSPPGYFVQNLFPTSVGDGKAIFC